MAGKRVNLFLNNSICDAADEERAKLEPPESRSLFFNVAAKERVRRIRRKRARNG